MTLSEREGDICVWNIFCTHKSENITRFNCHVFTHESSESVHGMWSCDLNFTVEIEGVFEVTVTYTAKVVIGLSRKRRYKEMLQQTTNRKC